MTRRRAASRPNSRPASSSAPRARAASTTARCSWCSRRFAGSIPIRIACKAFARMMHPQRAAADRRHVGGAAGAAARREERSPSGPAQSHCHRPRAQLRVWPAAQQIHHAYRGGFLEHITKMAEVGRFVARAYGADDDLGPCRRRAARHRQAARARLRRRRRQLHARRQHGRPHRARPDAGARDDQRHLRISRSSCARRSNTWSPRTTAPASTVRRSSRRRSKPSSSPRSTSSTRSSTRSAARSRRPVRRRVHGVE